MATLARGTGGHERQETHGGRRRVARSVARLARALALTGALSVSTGIAAAAQPPQQSPAQEGFVPVDKLPTQEQLPAAPLVMTAYAVAWVAVFGYLVSIWNRLGRVEREIQAVSRRVEAEGRR
jgi:CcmD family protein